ncbi:hypothetical protein [Streptococcus equi]|uniref:hypothetical protein n=1 Tax=Streptococcus equi TaxID=1336 RepID=UPI001E4CF67F|nr:hypothetical protein [Streptococcus equi]
MAGLFISKMEGCGYEIKIGKHIAFRTKNQQRFTRAKTIGANYTEEKIKERILNKDKELGNIIDLKNNDKAKLSKGYEHWQQNIILRLLLLRLLKSGTKDLSQWRN